MAMTQPFFV